MTGLRKLVDNITKYRGELVAASVSGLVGWISSELARQWLDAPLIDQLIVFLLASLMLFLILFSIKIKRDITWKMTYLHGHMVRVFGPQSWNQFSERATHFAEEKHFLARVLVERYLSDTIRSACRAYKESTKNSPANVIVIIDSGTTLTPVFPAIKKIGFPDNLGIERDSIFVYTNSVSGVNEFNLADVPEELDGSNLVLLGGNPLATYRATTGELTLNELDRISEDAKKNSTLIVGVLTANWITVGPGYEQLHLCAKGPGHLDFKRKVQEISHRILVVSPLGKLLRDREAHTLNEIMDSEGLEQYKSISLQSGDVSLDEECVMRKEVVLLTTYRRSKGALLFEHSDELFKTHQTTDVNVAPAYRLADEKRRPLYAPRGTRREQRGIEVPRNYIWTHRGPLLAIYDF